MEKELHLDVIDKVKLYESFEVAAVQVIDSVVKGPQPFILSFINAHCYNLCFKNADFKNSILKSDMILRDGKGMEILYKTIGKEPGINLNGTDFIPYLIEKSPFKTLAVFGTDQPYLQRAVDHLSAKGFEVLAQSTGFYSTDHYINLLEDKKPELILLGMGMPKQEIVSIALKENLDYSTLIINGGAIIDFIGGKVSRAPLWMRKVGLEWMYRLIAEPRRLFNRYVIGNYIFLKRMPLLKKISRGK